MRIELRSLETTEEQVIFEISYQDFRENEWQVRFGDSGWESSHGWTLCSRGHPEVHTDWPEDTGGKWFFLRGWRSASDLSPLMAPRTEWGSIVAAVHEFNTIYDEFNTLYDDSTTLQSLEEEFFNRNAPITS